MNRDVAVSFTLNPTHVNDIVVLVDLMTASASTEDTYFTSPAVVSSVTQLLMSIEDYVNTHQIKEPGEPFESMEWTIVAAYMKNISEDIFRKLRAE